MQQPEEVRKNVSSTKQSWQSRVARPLRPVAPGANGQAQTISLGGGDGGHVVGRGGATRHGAARTPLRPWHSAISGPRLPLAHSARSLATLLPT